MLKDKVAIITGGAQGIGYAVAERYVAEGAKVALWDVNEDQLTAARSKLTDMGGTVKTQVVNVTDSKAVAEAMEAVEKDLGPVDVVVNNAGITRDGMLHKMTDEQWDLVIDVNLKGVFLVGREAAKRMRDRGHGVILNTSSVVGIWGNIGQSNYAATKFGVIGLTKTWAKELGRKNIRVNAIAPGYTNTEMMQTVPEKVLDGICSKTPLGRLAEPKEIASAFTYLASDEAAFITGQVLAVDGGLVI